MTLKPKPPRTWFFTLAIFLLRIFCLLFFPYRIHRREQLWMNAPYILVGNHSHFVDPIYMGLACIPYEIHFIGKKELVKGPVTRFVFNHLHMISVARHESDIAAMRAARKVLKDGHVLGIFPEGTRNKGELMSHMESGPSLIALSTRKPIVPLYVHHPKPFRVTPVYVGSPIPFDDITGVDTESSTLLNDRIREAFLSLKQEAENA